MLNLHNLKVGVLLEEARSLYPAFSARARWVELL